MRFQNYTTIVSMEMERYNICSNHTNFVPKFVTNLKMTPMASIMLVEFGAPNGAVKNKLLLGVRISIRIPPLFLKYHIAVDRVSGRRFE